MFLVKQGGKWKDDRDYRVTAVDLAVLFSVEMQWA